MSEIKGSLEELKELTTELKEINKRAKEIRERKKILEAEVMRFLEDIDKKAIQYKNVTFVSGKKKKTARKKKLEKLVDGQQVLQKYGVVNPMQCLEEVVQAMKGAVSEEKTLKTKELVFLEDL